MCYTTDPEKEWEFCDVPICGKNEQNSSTIDPGCQEGNPMGASYSGFMNHTATGKACQVWSEADYAEEGEHNHCRNPDDDPDAIPIILMGNGSIALFQPVQHLFNL